MGSPWRAETGKSALVGALVGGLVGPLVDPLVGPLVGRGSLSPVLCVVQKLHCKQEASNCKQKNRIRINSAMP